MNETNTTVTGDADENNTAAIHSATSEALPSAGATSESDDAPPTALSGAKMTLNTLAQEFIEGESNTLQCDYDTLSERCAWIALRVVAVIPPPLRVLEPSDGLRNKLIEAIAEMAREPCEQFTGNIGEKNQELEIYKIATDFLWDMFK
jgi:hypothetical protein